MDQNVPLATALAEIDSHIGEQSKVDKKAGTLLKRDDVKLSVETSDFYGITAVTSFSDSSESNGGRMEAKGSHHKEMTKGSKSQESIVKPYKSKQNKKQTPVNQRQTPVEKTGFEELKESIGDTKVKSFGKSWVAKMKRRRSRAPSLASLGNAMARINAGAKVSSPDNGAILRTLSLSRIRRNSSTLNFSSPLASPVGSPLSSGRSSLDSPSVLKSIKSDNWQKHIDVSEVARIARKSNIISNAGTLPDEQIVSLLEKSEFRRYDPGQFLFLQGDESDGMYLILVGNVMVLREEKLDRNAGENCSDSSDSDLDSQDDDDSEATKNFKIAGAKSRRSTIHDNRPGQHEHADTRVPIGYRFVAQMTAGDSFGEASLLNNAPRNAAILAKTPLACLFISRVLFQKLLKWGMLDLSAQLHKSKVRTKIYDIVKKSPTLSDALTQDMIYDLIDKGQRRTYEPGAVIFHEGESGDGMHIVLSGYIRIVKMSKAQAQKDMLAKRNEHSKADQQNRLASRDYSDATVLSTMSQADLFGEMALLTKAKRTATAIVAGARGGATTLFVSHKLYKKVEAASGGQLEADIVRARLSLLRSGFMDMTHPFSRLSQDTKRKLMDVMRLVRFPHGEYICKQGEVASRMYFILKGRVLVTKNEEISGKGRKQHRKETVLARLYPNKYFGEVALVNDSCRRTANCISDDENGCILFCLHKISFDALVMQQFSNQSVKMQMELNSQAASMGLIISEQDAFTDSVNMPRVQIQETQAENKLQRHSSLADVATELSDLEKQHAHTREYVIAQVHERRHSPTGLDDFSFLLKVIPRLSKQISRRRMQDDGLLQSIFSVNNVEPTKLAVAAVLRDVLCNIPRGCRTSSQICFLMIALQSTNFYEELCQPTLAQHQWAMLCQQLYYRSIKAGSSLYRVGEPGWNCFGILSGCLECQSRLNLKTGSQVMQEKRVKKSLLKSGEIVGVCQLQGLQVRIETVVSKIPSELVCLETAAWVRIRGVGEYTPLRERIRTLKSCPLFENWSHDGIAYLAFLLKEEVHSKGDYIARRGNSLRGLFVVLDGEVSVSRSAKKINRDEKINEENVKRNEVTIDQNSVSRCRKKREVSASEKLDQSIVFIKGSVFGLSGVLHSYSEAKVEANRSQPTSQEGHTTSSAPSSCKSDMSAVARTTCRVLRLEPKNFSLIKEEQQFNTMLKLRELHRKQTMQFENLEEEKCRSADKHFVNDPSSKWLELSRSKRKEVKPPPIMACTLNRASHSVISEVAKESVKPMRNLASDLAKIEKSKVMVVVSGKAGKLPLCRSKESQKMNPEVQNTEDLSKMSAATSMDWSTRQRNKRNQRNLLKRRKEKSCNDTSARNASDGDDNDNVSIASLPAYDRQTKSFNRNDYNKLRKDPIYQRKRAGRYKLERDQVWLQKGDALHATAAQDPILPFVASSASWLSRPGIAVPLAAAAALSSDANCIPNTKPKPSQKSAALNPSQGSESSIKAGSRTRHRGGETKSRLKVKREKIKKSLCRAVVMPELSEVPTAKSPHLMKTKFDILESALESRSSRSLHIEATTDAKHNTSKTSDVSREMGPTAGVADPPESDSNSASNIPSDEQIGRNIHTPDELSWMNEAAYEAMHTVRQNRTRTTQNCIDEPKPITRQAASNDFVTSAFSSMPKKRPQMRKRGGNVKQREHLTEIPTHSRDAISRRNFPLPKLSAAQRSRSVDDLRRQQDAIQGRGGFFF